MATHYQNVASSIMIVSMVVVLILVYGIAAVNIKAFHKIDELEDL